MKQLLPILPLIIPLLTAVATFLTWRSRTIQRRVSLAGSLMFLAAAISLMSHLVDGDILVVEIGGWEAPFGIVLVADAFAGAIILTTALIGVSLTVYAAGALDCRREIFGFHALIQLLLAGCSGALLTGDLFNLYIWLEVILISAFVLMTLGGERKQLRGAVWYVLFNFMASSVFLAAIAIIYSQTGTLNLAHLAIILPELPSPGIGSVASFLFLATLGTKAALFPLFFWLPFSYPTPPPVISAVFGGLLTKIYVCVIFRLFTTVFRGHTELMQQMILPVAGLTMLLGVLGALGQKGMRRILSFHVISQIGYMIFGLGLMTPLGIAGGLYFLIHNIVVKTALFLTTGIAGSLRNSMAVHEGKWSHPPPRLLSISFFVAAIALAGFPPLSGFFGKLALVKAGLDSGMHVLVAIALFTGLLTLLSMMKIWGNVFWDREAGSGGRPPEDELSPWQKTARLLPGWLLVATSVLLGVGAGPVFDAMLLAANQLLDPSIYTEAVLP